MTTTTAPAAVLDFQQNLQPTTELTTDIATISRVGRSTVDAMSFTELDDFVNMGVRCIAGNRAQAIMAHKALVPAILRIQAALSSQGKRTDLPGTPAGLTFTAWIKEKNQLSKSTVYRLLAQAGISQKQLPVGCTVRDIGSGEVGKVLRAYTEDDGQSKFEVQFKGDKTESSAESLEKIPTRKVAIDDRFIFTDMGEDYEFSYGGNAKFDREKVQKIQKARPKPAPKPKPKLALVKQKAKDPCKGGVPVQGVQQ